jgi:Protein of unknown function (DUF3159)
MDEAVARRASAWTLTAAARTSDDSTAAPRLAKGPILAAVARRGIPNLVEATIFPAVLFVVVLATLGTGAAMIAVLAWSYGAILRRLLLGRRVPAILVLATLGLTIRTLVGLASGSTFAYFVQPIATTVALAALFLGSVFVRRPVIGRLADDFCPISAEVATRPAIMRLFTGLTVLWAGVHVATAATTFGMLVSLSVPMFVTLKTIACFAITAAAIVVTVVWALNTARREDLVFAPHDPAPVLVVVPA